MTPLQVAIFLNFLSLALVVGISLTAERRFQKSFFSFWILANVWELAASLFDALAGQIGRPAWLGTPGILLLTACLYYLLATGFAAQGKSLPGRFLPLGLGASAAFGLAGWALGASYYMLSAPYLLAISGVLFWLGGVFWRLRRGDPRANVLFLSLPFFLRAVWPLCYLGMLGTPHEVTLYATHALLHLLTGIGMVMFLATDTLERLNTQRAELMAKNEELLALDRLKSNFLANVNHELRTPLAAVCGAAELLATAELPPDEAEPLRRTLAENAGMLERTVRNLLDCSQLETREMVFLFEEGELGAVAAEAAEAAEEILLLRRTALRLDLPEEPVWARFDRTRLREALLHLISNASKFSPEGGTVTLRVRATAVATYMEVEDDGVGIEPADQVKVFDKFYQVESSSTRRYGGAGLGLAIARGIAEAHEGRVELESAPGRGSTFRVVLPRPTAEGAIA